MANTGLAFSLGIRCPQPDYLHCKPGAVSTHARILAFLTCFVGDTGQLSSGLSARDGLSTNLSDNLRSLPAYAKLCPPPGAPDRGETGLPSAFQYVYNSGDYLAGSCLSAVSPGTLVQGHRALHREPCLVRSTQGLAPSSPRPVLMLCRGNPGTLEDRPHQPRSAAVPLVPTESSLPTGGLLLTPLFTGERRKAQRG